MINPNRRAFLRGMAATGGAVGAMTVFPPAIQRALAIEANRRTGSIQDVEHIVILMQENRSFDHYFGTLAGIRGFGDPFPIPRPDATGITGKTVWVQPNASARVTGTPIAPFHLNTEQNFNTMRVAGTPHSWTDAQYAWNNGMLNAWPKFKANHSMGYFKEQDMPFQFALANAFTLCDAYYCSFHGGTNTNRLFLWTGSNDPHATGNGPATYNDYDWFESNPGNDGGYTWMTYTERLQDAGIAWQIYENMADNFTDNPLAGFHSFRDAWFQRPGYSQALRDRGVSTRDLDKLKEDVLADKLPQVSWIVATAEGSEHPGPSSPAQGADYTAKVLEALTANPEVWSKTVLFINFDENDGFFDHVPPPAVPSYLTYDADPEHAVLAGASTVDTSGEYHEHLVSYHNNATEQALLHRAYGLGPRVPMYVISPWSKGGWVNSEVFDHTSVIRFIETRFGVMEPNISAWRRAVCGDLTSTFNFADPDDNAFYNNLPDTEALAARARTIPTQPVPVPPSPYVLPVQASGLRPARALPYNLAVDCAVKPNPAKLSQISVELAFRNTGAATAVFHVYDRLNLATPPRRYTVEPDKALNGIWSPSASGLYDLWVLGPNGFHRHFTGNARRVAAAAQPNPEVLAEHLPNSGELRLTLRNTGTGACTFSLVANKYYPATPTSHAVPAKSETTVTLPLSASAHWYDYSLKVTGNTGYSRRLAGHVETGAHSFSDPAIGGTAIDKQFVVG